MGKNVIHVPTCHSTNALAEQILADEGISEGTVIIADEQTNGTGQKDNIWLSDPGKNLTFSAIIYPTFLPLELQFFISIISSLAIKNSLQKLIGEEVKVKWPNDVMVSNKKVAGILIKNSLDKRKIKSTIIGVGLNVNQDVFPIENA